MTQLDSTVLALRLLLGAIMIAHGWNHWRGKGGVEGTAGWFASLGLAPPTVHAWASIVVELAAGAALVLGLLTPLACAAVVGVMVVAGIAAHRRNGFFVFRDGYEYVLFVGVVALAVASLGPGRISVDRALGIDVRLDGGTGVAIAALGVLAAAAMLAACWRPATATSK